jgi:hypothetical protein
MPSGSSRDVERALTFRLGMILVCQVSGAAALVSVSTCVLCHYGRGCTSDEELGMSAAVTLGVGCERR